MLYPLAAISIQSACLVLCRGKFVDVYDTHMTICPVGDGATTKEYEAFACMDSRLDIRLRFIEALAHEFRHTDLSFTLSKLEKTFLTIVSFQVLM